MRVLLDTHALLWFLEDNDKVSDRVKFEIENAEIVLFSLVSFWELCIKHSLGKLKISYGFGEYHKRLISLGFVELPIQIEDIELMGKMPYYHRDPFDRMLVAQAKTNNLILVTKDETLKQYEIPVLW